MKYPLILFLAFIFASCQKKASDLQPYFNVTIDSPTNLDNYIVRNVHVQIDKRFTDVDYTAVLHLYPFGEFSNGGREQNLLIKDGTANTSVKSDSTGTAYLDITINGSTQTVIITFARSPIDTLDVQVTKNDVPADSYSYAEISISSKVPNLIKSKTSITLTTDKGKFANGSSTFSTTLGLDGVIHAYLKNNRAEISNVTASVSSTYTKEFTVRFIPAPADHLFINLDRSVLQRLPGSAVSISASLLRDTGQVSDGQVVNFYDSTAVGSIGTFLQTSALVTNGLASATYSLQDTTYRGYIYLIGRVIGANGSTIRGINKVLVQ